MSNHSIRHATIDDFVGVMAIGDVLYGIDYLQHRYHSFLADPNATSYVYLVGDEIVGFCCAFLVDDGMTLVFRASRVKDGFKGQGIYRKLANHVYVEYKKIPSIKYEAFTTHNKNYDKKKESLLKTYTELSRKTVKSYYFNMNELNLPVLKPYRNAREMTSEDVASLLSAESTHPHFLPDEKL